METSEQSVEEQTSESQPQNSLLEVQEDAPRPDADGQDNNSDGLPDSSSDSGKDEVLQERPENIAEQFWDKDKGEVRTDALGKSYNDLRKEYNKLKQGSTKEAIPETLEDYMGDWQVPHRMRAGEGEKEGNEYTRFGELTGDDPVIQSLADNARKHGIPPSKFQDFMQDTLDSVHEMLADPVDLETEKSKLGENADRIISTNAAWLNQLNKTGVFNEDQYNHLLEIGSTALGVEVINALRLNSGEKPIPIGPSVNEGAKSQEEVRAMVGDPLYREDSPKGEAYRMKVEEEFRKAFPD